MTQNIERGGTLDTARVMHLHDRLMRAYLFTLNKDGLTESNLSAYDVDLILLALKHLAAASRS